jgi:hypothetical protein
MPSNRSESRQRRRRRSKVSSDGGATSTATHTRNTETEESLYYDLNVPLILDKNHATDNHGNIEYENSDAGTDAGTGTTANNGLSKENSALISRLNQIGYSVIALSHSIKGRFDLDKDAASQTIPSSCTFMSRIQNGDNKSSKESNKKRVKLSGNRRVDGSGSNSNRSCRILKRLNVIIEEASDLELYCNNVPNGATSEALNSYDIIAMSPQNDTSFSAICTTSASTGTSNMSNHYHCDIIILDYTAGRGGIQLPYKLKTSDVRAAANRGIVFELPYGPALIDPSKRKAFVQTAHLFLNTCTGGGIKDNDGDDNDNDGDNDEHDLPPKIIISSGQRIFENNDRGIMALRSPGDMINFANIILSMDQKNSRDALSSNAYHALQKGRNRRRMCKGESSMSLNLEVGDYIPDDISNAEASLESNNKNNINDNMQEIANNMFINSEESRNETNIEESDDEEDFLKL